VSDIRAYLVTTVVVFAVVSLIHLVRAINGWSFTIGPYDLPMAVSWIGFVVTAGLAAWSFILMRQA